MRIVITGPKGSGKSTVGARFARLADIPFIETDEVIEEIYAGRKGQKLSCREIYTVEGEAFFRTLEKEAIASISDKDWCVISTGGSTMLNPGSRAALRENSLLVLFKAEDDLLWGRIKQGGLPPFLAGEDGRSVHALRNARLYEAVEHLADIVLTVESDHEASLHNTLAGLVEAHLQLGSSSPNTFGNIIRVTTFGESHGKAVGAVLDGIKPGTPVDEADIQRQLDRRRPGQSKVATARNEKDAVQILSGVFEGKATGTPICMLIYNEDQDSARYDYLRDVFRPGHADLTFWKKYGLRDHRGGGRSSGRETAGRVMAGAIARKILEDAGIMITAYAEEIAGIKCETVDLNIIETNSVRAADQKASALMEEAIVRAKMEHDSVGGIVRLIIKNAPAGLGDPVFGKLDARLAAAMVSIGAVKGVEFGDGFEAARVRGSENNDEMADGVFLSNHAGGVLGGMSSGADILMRIAVKPTPSILKEQKTQTASGENAEIIVEGRHDPCIVPRIIPVIESMAALVVLDCIRMNEALKR